MPAPHGHRTRTGWDRVFKGWVRECECGGRSAGSSLDEVIRLHDAAHRKDS